MDWYLKAAKEKEYDSEERLIIDASFLEGGGQILRITAALSCILRIPIRVKNIRVGSERPGLKPQHVAGLQLIASLCNGKLDKCVIGSQEITFNPGSRIRAGLFVADTKTSGNVCWLIHAALPCLMYSYSDCTLELYGGTNCDLAPQIDYITLVFQPVAERFGLRFDLDLIKRGFFPKGGGKVILKSEPVKCLYPVVLIKPGEVKKIYCRSFVAGKVPENFISKLSQSISKALKKKVPRVEIKQDNLKEEMAEGSALGTIIVAKTSTGCFLAGSALGKPKTSVEKTGSLAVQQLMEAIGSKGCVDKYLQDQIILLMALANGESRVLSGPLTLNTKATIRVIQLMTQVSFTLNQQENNTVVITCHGLGHINPYYKS